MSSACTTDQLSSKCSRSCSRPLTFQLLQRQIWHHHLPDMALPLLPITSRGPQVPLQPVGLAGPEDGSHGDVLSRVHQHHRSALGTAAGHNTGARVAVQYWSAVCTTSTRAYGSESHCDYPLLHADVNTLCARNISIMVQRPEQPKKGLTMLLPSAAPPCALHGSCPAGLGTASLHHLSGPACASGAPPSRWARCRDRERISRCTNSSPLQQAYMKRCPSVLYTPGTGHNQHLCLADTCGGLKNQKPTVAVALLCRLHGSNGV